MKADFGRDNERESCVLQPESDTTERVTLAQIYVMLPQILQNRCNKQFLGAALVLLISMVCALYFGNVLYFAIGLGFAFFIAGLGVRLLWRCKIGKIVYKQMECVKNYSLPMAKSKTLILREYDIPVGDERGIHKYQIANTKDTGMLTKGTLLNIYVDLDAPSELLAWQVIG